MKRGLRAIGGFRGIVVEARGKFVTEGVGVVVVEASVIEPSEEGECDGRCLALRASRRERGCETEGTRRS